MFYHLPMFLNDYINNYLSHLNKRCSINRANYIYEYQNYNKAAPYKTRMSSSTNKKICFSASW